VKRGKLGKRINPPKAPKILKPLEPKVPPGRLAPPFNYKGGKKNPSLEKRKTEK